MQCGAAVATPATTVSACACRRVKLRRKMQTMPDKNTTQRGDPRAWIRIFLGAAGVRAGWRAAAFLAVIVLLESQGGRVIDYEREFFGAGANAGGVLFEKAIAFFVVLAVVLIFGALERRTLAEYGFPLRKMFGRNFWVGALWGLGILSANIALMALLGAYSFGKIVLPIGKVLEYGLLWLAADVMVALSEEFAFRGYLQFTLTRGMGFWPASAVTSILFGLVHLDRSASWQDITNIVLLALFVCLALRRTGNLWLGIGSHASFDWGLSFLYSCDANAHGHLSNATLHGPGWLTGGAAGPESNIFNALLVAVGAWLLSRVYSVVAYPTVERLRTDVSSPRTAS
jgi:uncharacterized protein